MNQVPKAACVFMVNHPKQTIRVVNRPGSTVYALPGGKHEIGESTKETAIRETMEETGIDIRGVVAETPFFTSMCYGEQDYLVNCFLAMPVTDDVSRGIEPDIESRMIPISEFLADNAFPEFNKAAWDAFTKM